MDNKIQKAIEAFEKPSKHIKCVHKCENGMEFLSYSADLVAAFETAIDGMKELEQYRSIGTTEDLQKSIDVRKRVTEIVDRQLVAGKNNFKETYDCFWEIVKVVQDNY